MPSPDPGPRLVEQLVADLAWAVESPSLVHGSEVAASGRIDKTLIDRDHLVATIGSLPRRVGHYFERLVHYWLAHVRRVEIVGTGVQVLDGKRTVGEIDFLFRDESGPLTHWEAAVKFYLHRPGRAASEYPGPNARDNFEAKATKLFDQQLRLSERSHPQVTVRQAFVKGRVFYHPGLAEPEALPKYRAANHLREYWMPSSRWGELIDRWPDALATVLDKPHWLAPPVDQADALPIASDELHDRLRASDHPVMISIVDGSGSHELARVCVVNTSWDTHVTVSDT